MRRGTPRPIRRALKPQHTTEWENKIHDWRDLWTSSMDTADATELLQSLRHVGRGRRTPGQARSQLEDDLKEKIARLDISEGYRASLRQQLFRERGRIAKQKELNHYQEVLRNLRQGGWGKQAMAPMMKPMTTCTFDDGTTLTNDEDIARAASAYYSKLFGPETRPTRRDRGRWRANEKVAGRGERPADVVAAAMGLLGVAGDRSRLSAPPRPGAHVAATVS